MFRKSLFLPIVLLLTACTTATLPADQHAISTRPNPIQVTNTEAPRSLPTTAIPMDDGNATSTNTPHMTTENSVAATTTPVASPTNVRVQDDNEYSFPQLLGYDSIPPVYDPIFVPAEEPPLQDEELVMGVAINGEAKAYPVTVLRFREMVNDELGGIPILVTW